MTNLSGPRNWTSKVATYRAYLLASFRIALSPQRKSQQLNSDVPDPPWSWPVFFDTMAELKPVESPNATKQKHSHWECQRGSRWARFSIKRRSNLESQFHTKGKVLYILCPADLSTLSRPPCRRTERYKDFHSGPSATSTTENHPMWRYTARKNWTNLRNTQRPSRVQPVHPHL